MMSRLLVGAGAVLLSTSFVSMSVNAGQHTHDPAAGTAARNAMKAAPPGALPALPKVPFEPVRPMAVVQQVYEFAARHPEVLRYVPCYCGCERVGHTGNHDCFVKSRAASGRILEWDAHGLGCTVCLDVGRDAMTMFNAGAPVTAIRAAIEKKYAPHFPSSTPTPDPPRASGRTSE